MSSPGSRDPLIGQEIDGYYIESILGQGGMARVYRGYDVRLNRHVVIKVIKPGVSADQDYRVRFEKEARAIAQLEHQHIVRIYRFGEVNGLYYMAMQYVDGADLSWILKDYAADHELLPHADVARIIEQIGAALDYAHSRGVIHRDVKPSNIMLNNDGDATLTDFGLALMEAEGTHGEVFGTPHYMAPEQALDAGGVVPQSDLYSLGIILYEMLTGSLPFDGQNAVAIARQHVTLAPPDPIQRNPGLHPAFVPVLDKALQKAPQQRYQSGAELAVALQEAMTAARRSPRAQPQTLLHLSQQDIPDKVSKFHTEYPLLPLSPVYKPNVIVPAQARLAAYGYNRRVRLVFTGAILALVVLCGIFAVFTQAISPPAQPVILTSPPTSAAANAVPDTASTTPPLSMTPTLLLGPLTTPAPTSAQAAVLRFITAGEDSLYVMNISPLPLALSPLELRGTDRGGVGGSEWGVTILSNQDCVRILKDNNAVTPNVTCNVVGSAITRDGPERFWKPEFGSFQVYYDGMLVDECPTSGCILPIPVSL